ncbi:hypothetical protein E2C01_011973 [Portunus trituberculatus]|uniref:Uncharacterized protein n=1 Tax=Portunus trituberculatus TaxID=210409 RepID=A0A5B7DCX0_PORTR|nr:hypothetical protein [Portunus trituberculatus]
MKIGQNFAWSNAEIFKLGFANHQRFARFLGVPKWLI